MVLGFSKYQTKSTSYLYFVNKIWRIDLFSILFNGLEPLKLIVLKLQKRNSYIYEAYQMIEKVIADIKYLR